VVAAGGRTTKIDASPYAQSGTGMRTPTSPCACLGSKDPTLTDQPTTQWVRPTRRADRRIYGTNDVTGGAAPLHANEGIRFSKPDPNFNHTLIITPTHANDGIRRSSAARRH